MLRIQDPGEVRQTHRVSWHDVGRTKETGSWSKRNAKQKLALEIIQRHLSTRDTISKMRAPKQGLRCWRRSGLKNGVQKQARPVASLVEKIRTSSRKHDCLWMESWWHSLDERELLFASVCSHNHHAFIFQTAQQWSLVVFVSGTGTACSTALRKNTVLLKMSRGLTMQTQSTSAARSSKKKYLAEARLKSDYRQHIQQAGHIPGRRQTAAELCEPPVRLL